MTEPNFDNIAGACLARVYEVRKDGLLAEVAVVAEQLRQVWNARGAADITAMAPVIEKLGDAMDPDNARVFVTDTIRSTDVD